MIVSMTGRAGQYDLLFEKNEGRFIACLPLGTPDGSYVVELDALDEFGNHFIWRGELFLCSGIEKLVPMPNRIAFRLAKSRLHLMRQKERFFLRKK